jgi:two-component system, NarL family, response regulator NreC
LVLRLKRGVASPVAEPGSGSFSGACEPTPQLEPLLGSKWEDNDPHRKRALLVAEHTVFRQALALLIEWHTNFKTVQAGSLTEARRIFGKLAAEPNLVVVDLELPYGDGFVLTGELRRAKPDVSILALTISQDPERATRAKEAGAGEVLTMAASSEDLLEGVRRQGNG